jgi:hypothetical protein
MSERHASEPLVCCDFANPAIDAVGGRYYYSLIRDLIDAGYFPVFTSHRATLSSFGTSHLKSLLLQERLGFVRSLEEFREPYLLLTDRKISAPPLASRMVNVEYEWRISNGAKELPFPVFVHPLITTKTKLPFQYDIEALRTARIFFGGNTKQGKYDKSLIGERYHMLSRRAMIAEALGHFSPDMIHSPSNAKEWLNSSLPHSFVLFETQLCQIPQDRWLEALSKADFFLACPGVGMPLCHNLIEALAAGAIPIMQYANYLTPPLQDEVNCLAFCDESSLRMALARALTMDYDQILAMRRNVRSYYDENLAPGKFAARLFNGPQTLLMNDYRVPR